MMKLLFLTLSGRMDSLQNRGIYTDLLRCFHKNGHDIYVAFPYERRKKKKTTLYEQERFHALGLKTLNITKTNYIEKGIGTVLLEYQYLRQINKYWSEINFDLVLFSTPPTSFNKVVTSIKKKTGAKSYLLQKDFFLQGAVDLGVIKKGSFIYRYFKRQEDELYRISDYIGCMSPANVDFVLSRYPLIEKQRVEICPNSIEIVNEENVCDRVAMRRKYKIPIDVPVLMYGGNLGKPQGIDFIIQVLESNKNRKDRFFCIVGSGTEFNKLLDWYKSTHPSNVLIHSEVPKEDYDLLIKAADIGLIFLDYRFTEPNFPSRLLSYLENKLPVLSSTDRATDVGNIIEDNRIGYSSFSDDLEDFNSKLDKLLTEKDNWAAMGQRGFDYLLAHYQVAHSYEIIMKHFN